MAGYPKKPSRIKVAGKRRKPRPPMWDELRKDRNLRNDPRVIQRWREMWAKLRTLASDDLFLCETEKLRNSLSSALDANQREVKRFFDLFPIQAGPELPNIRRYLLRLDDKPLRKLLWRYTQYVSKYGVRMRLSGRAPHFRLRALPSKGSMFHARLVGGDLVPFNEVPEHLMDITNFESRKLEIPEVLTKQIERGEATFVRIEDGFLASPLTQLEDLAADSHVLTYVLHKAERPYLMLLVGENVDKKVIHKARTVITAFQRKVFGVRRGGKSKDIGKLRRARNLARKPGPAKEKAWSIMPHNTPEAAQSYFSKAKKSFRP